MSSLTNEGGKLRRDRMLTRDRDFKLLPEPVWRALSCWYGFSISLPRTVSSPLYLLSISPLSPLPLLYLLSTSSLPPLYLPCISSASSLSPLYLLFTSSLYSLYLLFTSSLSPLYLLSTFSISSLSPLFIHIYDFPLPPVGGGTPSR